MKQLHTPLERFLIQSYRVVRFLSFCIWLIILGVSLYQEVNSQAALSLRIFTALVGIPVIAPLFHGLIFRHDQPHHLFVFAGTMGIFSIFGLFSAPTISLPLTIVWALIFVLGLIGYYASLAQRQAQRTYTSSQFQTPKAVQVERIAPAVPLSNVALIQSQVEETKQEIFRYHQQIDQLRAQLGQCEAYMERVQKQLAQSNLTEANQQTSQQLLNSLKDRQENLRLLVSFYQEVIKHHKQDQANLEVRLGNMEIAAFLQAQNDVTAYSSMEQSLLDLAFRQHVRSLDAAIHQVDGSLELNVQDLSSALKQRLAETIQLLKA